MMRYQIRVKTVVTNRVVRTLIVACAEEELTFLLEIASFWKFSVTEDCDDEKGKVSNLTLYRGGEEGDWRELAVSLLVEAGDLHHVLRAGPQLLQTSPAIPLA